MEMSGEHRLPAPRETVWKALNDPEVLKACIPGCESLTENEAGDGFDARVKAKVGPVKATFDGSVKLENVNAPESYTITGEGKGGAAGFAKGSADVHLAEDGAETVLTYKVKAQVGGKLAQIGSRLIDSTAKKYANDFFTKFVEIVGDGEQTAAATTTETATEGKSAETSAEKSSTPPAESAPSAAEVDDGMKEAEPAEDTREKATQAAMDAVEARHGKPKAGLSGMTWALIVIVAALILLGIFAGA